MMKTRTLKFPGINILPREYRRRILSRREGLLLLLVLGLALLVLNSYQGLAETRSLLANLPAQQRSLVAATNKYKVQGEQAQALRQEIATLQAELQKAQKVSETLTGERVNWSVLLEGVLTDLPPSITLTQLSKASKQLLVEGTSSGGFAPLEQYYQQLTALPGVLRVSITKTAAQTDGPGGLLVFSLALNLAGE